MGIALSELEVCAECGQFVEALDPNTGWCYSCSGTTPQAVQVTHVTILYFFSGQRTLSAQWLDRNADALDRLLAAGYSLLLAVEAVLKENRPICLCCGNEIRHRPSGSAIFCGKTPECRKSRRRLRYLRDTYNMPYDAALEKVLQLAKAGK